MARYTVRVVPNAKQRKIIADGEMLKVYVTAPAVEGKANEAVIEALAEHFGVKRRQIKIISGEKNRNKVVEISG